MPVFPRLSASQNIPFPTPSGVTIPSPVTTTRLSTPHPLFPESAEDDRRVVPAEGEGVGEDDLRRVGPGACRDVIQITLRIGCLTVDRWGDEAFRDGEDGDDRLERPGGAEGMAVH